MATTVTVSGPIFQPAVVSAAVDRLCRDIADDGGDAIAAQWLSNLNTSIRVNTGRYVSNINVRAEPHGALVNDNKVIYGNWLEGTGSRNKTTRFKGYSSLRRAVATVRPRIPAIVAPSVSRFVRRVN